MTQVYGQCATPDDVLHHANNLIRYLFSVCSWDLNPRGMKPRIGMYFMNLLTSSFRYRLHACNPLSHMVHRHFMAFWHIHRHIPPSAYIHINFDESW